MNRTDRILLETHIRNLDEMSRNIQQMRSVLQRRAHRLRVAPPAPAPVPIRQVRRLNREHMNEAPRLNMIDEFQQEIIQPAVVTPREEFRNKIVIKSLTMKKIEQEVILQEVCGICLENHKKIDSVHCNCNHVFGSICLSSWKRNCNNQSKKLSCPTCRSLVTQITEYRPRAPRTKKSAVIEITDIHEDYNNVFHVIPLIGEDDNDE